MANRIRRYSSITMPNDYLEIVDDVALRMAATNAADISENINIPSRRKVVQDAMYLLIKTLYPDLLPEYIQKLKDADCFELSADLKKFIQSS